jgi:hypothetical protein
MPDLSSGNDSHPATGLIDYDVDIANARMLREAYIRELVSKAHASVPELSPGAKRSLGAFGAALALAVAAFWGTMLTSPPRTEAGILEPARAEVQALRPGDALRSCEAGDSVSAFKCRNAWMMAHSKYSRR